MDVETITLPRSEEKVGLSVAKMYGGEKENDRLRVTMRFTHMSGNVRRGVYFRLKKEDIFQSLVKGNKLKANVVQDGEISFSVEILDTKPPEEKVIEILEKVDEGAYVRAKSGEIEDGVVEAVKEKFAN